VYGIEFLEFRIRDMDTNKELFAVKKPDDAPPFVPSSEEDEDSYRCIRYRFGSQFLKYRTIGTR
jgi:hypothetical protein